MSLQSTISFALSSNNKCSTVSGTTTTTTTRDARLPNERTNERTNRRGEENPKHERNLSPPPSSPSSRRTRRSSVPRIAAVVQSMTHHLSRRRGRYPSDDQPHACMYVQVCASAWSPYDMEDIVDINNKWFDIRSTNGLKHIQVGSSHSRTFVPPAA